MTDYLTGAAFAALFDAYEHTAFRLEVRDSYLGVPYEQERFRKFMAGEEDPEQRSRPWLDGVRRRAHEGKAMQRVRVVSSPPSGYARYPKGKVPKHVDDKWDTYWQTHTVDAKGNITAAP